MKEIEAIPAFTKMYFICSGIGALVGWNSILTALDYFADKFPYNVSFLFGIPLFISTNLFSYMIYIIARWFSINARIISGLILMMIVLIIMPILAALMPNDEGFYLTLALIFILGMSNAIMQGSSVSLASMFPYECISYYFTGTGIASISICILRMIMLEIFGDNDEKGVLIGTIVYFTISSCFLLFTLVTHVIFKKTEFCKYYLKLAKGKRKASNNGGVELAQNNVKEELLVGNTENGFKDPNENELEMSREVYKHDLKFIYKVFLKINPLPLLVWLIYVQTFMMFPGVALKKQLSGMSKAWSITLLIFVFAIFDTIGKYLSAMRKFYSKKSTIILVFLRFIFFVFYLLMATRDDIPVICDNWFAIFNMALFSLLNGYTTSCAMVLAPEECDNEEKETTGFLMTHPLYFGIMCGSFLALAFEGI